MSQKKNFWNEDTFWRWLVIRSAQILLNDTIPINEDTKPEKITTLKIIILHEETLIQKQIIFQNN